jgi:hypothetical protein
MATSKKAPAKKRTVVKHKTVSKSKAAQVKSFHVAPNQPNFMTVQLTRQTVYWSILLIFIIIMQLLILNAQFSAINATNLMG